MNPSRIAAAIPVVCFAVATVGVVAAAPASAINTDPILKPSVAISSDPITKPHQLNTDPVLKPGVAISPDPVIKPRSFGPPNIDRTVAISPANFDLPKPK